MRPGRSFGEQVGPTPPQPSSAAAESDGRSSPPGAPAGILYSASGEQYIAEALRSARSSLRHNDVPHMLYADREVNDAPELTIARFEPSAHPFADRISHMRRSPFERTIYLDSDTYIVDEIAHLLRVLDTYDVAVAYASYGALEDPEVPRVFYEFNAGVVAWRASERVAAFLKSWEETYLAWLSDEPFPGARAASRSGRGDQPAFRHCAWQHRLRLFVLPPEYNFRFKFPNTLRERVRVLHGRHDDYPALAARVNAHERLRIWPLPLGVRVRQRVRNVTLPLQRNVR